VSPTVQKVQNALPNGYVAKDGGSSVEVYRNSLLIASVNHGGLHLLSLSNTDIQAGVRGASALGASSSTLNAVIEKAFENAGVSIHNGYQAYRASESELIVTYRL
jgi:hypothetical protein